MRCPSASSWRRSAAGASVSWSCRTAASLRPQGRTSSLLGRPPRVGDLLELPEAAVAVARTIARRLVRHGGAALLIDYGYWDGFSDTLQALKDHAFANPLSDPARPILLPMFRSGGWPMPLEARRPRPGPARRATPAGSGIEERAPPKGGADPAQAARRRCALHRLTAPGATGMGDLFKVLGLIEGLAALGLAPTARS